MCVYLWNVSVSSAGWGNMTCSTLKWQVCTCTHSANSLWCKPQLFPSTDSMLSFVLMCPCFSSYAFMFIWRIKMRIRALEYILSVCRRNCLGEVGSVWRVCQENHVTTVKGVSLGQHKMSQQPSYLLSCFTAIVQGLICNVQNTAKPLI